MHRLSISFQLISLLGLLALTGAALAMTDADWERRNAGSSRLPVRPDHYAEDICRIISREAHRRAIPEDFLARLVWRESLFDPKALSPKGAQGIAQFMPGTARERGLADPFVPHEALQESAHLLGDLRDRLGNLGQAAAAYNAGATAVAAWRAGLGNLPYETQDYVQFITGRSVEDWRAAEADYAIPPLGPPGQFGQSCVKLVARQLNPEPAAARGAWKPWGVVVAGNASETVALKSYARIQGRFPSLLGGRDPFVQRKRNPAMGRRRIAFVMVGAGSRAEADSFCSKLRALGGACLVRRN